MFDSWIGRAYGTKRKVSFQTKELQWDLHEQLWRLNGGTIKILALPELDSLRQQFVLVH